MTLSLRAATLDDQEPLWLLHCSTMREYVDATWGWREAEQRDRFLQHFDPSQLQVIEADGQFVGVLEVDYHADHVFLASIEVQPQHQRCGIGSAIVRQVLADAEEQDLPVRLQVLNSNPAAEL